MGGKRFDTSDIDTSDDGFKVAGIVIPSEEVGIRLMHLNQLMKREKENPLFWVMVLLRELNILPEEMTCEIANHLGRSVTQMDVSEHEADSSPCAQCNHAE